MKGAGLHGDECLWLGGLGFGLDWVRVAPVGRAAGLGLNHGFSGYIGSRMG